MSLTVSEAIAKRRANRRFLDIPVAQDVLDRVVAKALEAPSAFNLQLRELVVVQDAAVKNAIYEAGYRQQIFRDAPAILVAVGCSEIFPDDATSIVGEQRLREIAQMKQALTAQRRREDALRDAMLTAGFALLAATEEGLASCPSSGWDEEGIKAAIGIGGRDDRAIALLIALGYSDQQPEHPGRRENRRIDNSYL